MVDANCERFGMELNGKMLGCPFQYLERSFIEEACDEHQCGGKHDCNVEDQTEHAAPGVEYEGQWEAGCAWQE